MPNLSTAIIELRDAVIAASFNVGDINTVVGRCGHPNAYAADTTGNETHAERVRELLWLAHGEAWLNTLMERLLNHRVGAQGLQEAIDAVNEATGETRDGWYSEKDPRSDTFVVADGGFANREDLRIRIDDMTKPVGAKRLLVLSGPTAVGKSFAYQLIEVVAQDAGDLLAYVDLSAWDREVDGTITGATLFDVANAVVTSLELDLPSLRTRTTDDSTVNNLAIELANAIKTKGKRTWLFFDDLDTSEAEPNVRSFVSALMQHAAGPAHTLLRIAVTGGELKPTDVFRGPQPKILDVELEIVKDGDIERYFRELWKHVRGDDLDENRARKAREQVRTKSNGDAYQLAECLWNVATGLFKPQGN